jgi:DNA-directed RNA polymerase specialized sigma24 family protein
MRPSADGLADVAQEVFSRLSRASEAAVSIDPHGYVMRTAAQVEREWKDSLPHHEPTLNEIQAAVNALPALAREILRLHVDGRTCQQIAEQLQLTRDAVLRDLVGTYRHLRRELLRDE